MAIASRNLDRQQDAVKYANEAIRHLDRMTARERFTDAWSGVSGDGRLPQDAWRNTTRSSRNIPADAAAYNNLALCATPPARLRRSRSRRAKQAKTLAAHAFGLPLQSGHRLDLCRRVHERRGRGQRSTRPREYRARLGGTCFRAASRRIRCRMRAPHSKGWRKALVPVRPAHRPAWRSSPLTKGGTRRPYEAVRGGRQAGSCGQECGACVGQAGGSRLRAAGGETPAAARPPSGARGCSPSSKIQFLTGRIFAEAGDTASGAAGDRRRSHRRCRTSRRRWPGFSRATSRWRRASEVLRAADQANGIIESGDRQPRHVDWTLRSGTGLSGGGASDTGRLRVRSLPDPAWRSVVAVSG